MILITDEIRALMLSNEAMARSGLSHDPEPVAKLFTPDAGATWLLAELDPDELHIAFGLFNLGLEFPKMDSVAIAQIESVRGRLGLPVERDRAFAADKPLSAYADAAPVAGQWIRAIIMLSFTSGLPRLSPREWRAKPRGQAQLPDPDTRLSS